MKLKGFYTYFRFSNFNFDDFDCELAFFSLLQGFSIPSSIFSADIDSTQEYHFFECFSFVMNIIYSSFHLSDISAKLCHFL